MKKRIRILSVIMIVISLSFLIVLPAEALDWDGDSSGGGGSGVDTNIKGFSIRFTDNQNMLGYRFSVIDRSGNIKSNKIIDVFRKTSAAPYANKACGTSYYKFSTKRNKKQLIENQNGSFSTKQCDTNCYKESEMGFDTELPDPDKMYLWQANSININVILNTVGIGNINNLIGGDKVLVEPIYDVRLEGDYHALTVTETAIYGKHLLGADSNGGVSYTAEKWGFISRYVNQHYYTQKSHNCFLSCFCYNVIKEVVNEMKYIIPKQKHWKETAQKEVKI